MTSITQVAGAQAAAPKKSAISLGYAFNRAGAILTVAGFGWVVPLGRLATGTEPRRQVAELWRQLGIPLAAIVLFLLAWGALAPKVQTSLGAVPGPVEVWAQVDNLIADHRAERAKEAAFNERQAKRNAEAKAEGGEVKTRRFTGKPTYLDQIATSLKTVFMGFVLATLVAVPLGVMCGLSKTVNAALNPLIQIFKPVSPLAWLPIVTMVVSATYVSNDPMFEKAFLNSAITVTLCSLWTTLINTAIGVASIDKDLVNVGRVLNLPMTTTIRKLVLPSALPYIFTGMRLSLGVGWMVLIAAEMLAQNPGLGKFVWDEFQNGSSQSLAKIMVAVLTIGLIGFLLDRVMMALQAMFSHSATR
ncbi:ABC-type nitrate/sulfonate/bicarbonate transport system [Paramagnetospirillum caucaseum]|uniref:ABC-type nitrate/sulfonate/bicarbonate transport system n=2 Tax=Paramagnetospirillum caucaseum TaxID=1244869 RepID=M2YC80_9PROT|nr:ABC-type nitrate/sulfonate/bicarbonate transport system [Paramagnetospirillum caucaseum]